MRLLSLLWVCLAWTVTASSASDPNFSGTWTLGQDSSGKRALPFEAWNSMRLSHQDEDVRCVPIAANTQTVKSRNLPGLNFTTDGKETTHKVGEWSARSIAKWEGTALLINTIVGGPYRYTQMDRWKLSRDGASLTIRRQIITIHGESESTLVYEKQ